MNLQGLVAAITKHVEEYVAQRQPRFYRGKITGQGSTNKLVRHQPAGDKVPSNFDVPVAIAYGTPVIGDKDGPTVGDDVVFAAINPKKPVALYKLLTNPDEKPPNTSGWAFDLSYFRSINSGRSSGQTTYDMKVMTGFPNSHFGYDSYFGIGSSNPNNDHWMNVTSGMDSGDGYDGLFQIMPPGKSGSGHDLDPTFLGFTADYPNYTGDSLVMWHDGKFVVTGSVLAGTYLGDGGGNSGTRWYKGSSPNPTWYLGASMVVGDPNYNVTPGNYATSIHTFLAKCSARFYGPVQIDGALSLGSGGLSGNLPLADGGNISLGTTTGTKLGTSSSQKLGFFNASPVVRPTISGSLSTVADPDAQAVLQSIINALKSSGGVGLFLDSTT